MKAPLVFVVIEDNTIIAEDIAEAIKEYAGTAVVLMWKKVVASVEAIDNIPKLTAAFLAMSVKELAESGLDDALARKESAIVLLRSPDQSGQAVGWHFLDRPFTTDDIHALLQRIGITTEDVRS